MSGKARDTGCIHLGKASIEKKVPASKNCGNVIILDSGGIVASLNGAAYIAAPALGVWLYGHHEVIGFATICALCAAVFAVDLANWMDSAIGIGYILAHSGACVLVADADLHQRQTVLNHACHHAGMASHAVAHDHRPSRKRPGDGAKSFPPKWSAARASPSS